MWMLEYRTTTPSTLYSGSRSAAAGSAAAAAGSAAGSGVWCHNNHHHHCCSYRSLLYQLSMRILILTYRIDHDD